MEYILVNIGYLLELWMIQVYIEIIWEQRICFNRFSCILFSINGFVVTGINIGIFPKIFALIIHVLLFLYLWVKYKRSLKENIVKYCLVFIISWATEVLAGIVVHYVADSIKDDIIKLIMVNSFAIAISILVAYIVKKKGKRFNIDVNYKSILRVVLICFVPICILVVSYAFNHMIYIWYCIIVAVLGIVLLLYLDKVQRSEYDVKQKELELNINKTYGQLYEEIINEIRRKQHNFDNQLAAIYSSHKIVNTIEELAELQSTYCAAITDDNEYEYILTACNEPIIAGFLYYKCISCKEQKVTVDCTVHIDKWSANMLMYELIELLGIFIDNAVEKELENIFDDKMIDVSLNEFANKFTISVSNRIDDASSVELNKIFDTGYSTKGTSRGLGLPRARQICEKYGLEIMVSFKNNPERNIIFTVCIPK